MFAFVVPSPSMLKGQRNHKIKCFSQGLDDLLGNRTNIGIKRMGDLDQKPFLNTCNQRFPRDEAQLQASTLCSLWQEHLKNPDWHPFKIIHDNGSPQVCLIGTILLFYFHTHFQVHNPSSD